MKVVFNNKSTANNYYISVPVYGDGTIPITAASVLTIGKVYDVINKSRLQENESDEDTIIQVKVLCDDNVERWIYKSYFIELDEHRDNQIKLIL
jgi:hypothetical protein